MTCNQCEIDAIMAKAYRKCGRDYSAQAEYLRHEVLTVKSKAVQDYLNKRIAMYDSLAVDSFWADINRYSWG